MSIIATAFECRVSVQGTTFTLTTTGRDGNPRSYVVDMARADMFTLEENTLLAALASAASGLESWEGDCSGGEIRLIASMRDKSAPVQPEAPAPVAPAVVVAEAPAAPVAPPPVQPDDAPLAVGDFVRVIRARSDRSRYGAVPAGSTGYIHRMGQGDYGPWAHISSEPHGQGDYARYLNRENLRRVSAAPTVPPISARAAQAPVNFTPYTPPVQPVALVSAPAVQLEAPAVVAEAPPAPAVVVLDASNPVHQSAETAALLIGNGQRRRRRRGNTMTTDLETLARIYRQSAKGYFQLVYYIPDCLSKRQPGQARAVCPNPAAFLRSRGLCHYDGSVWIGRVELFDDPVFVEWYNGMKELESHPVPAPYDPLSCDRVDYSADQLAVVRAIFRRQLEKSMRTAHTSMITTIASADATLAKAEAETKDALDAHTASVRTAIRAATERIQSAVVCAMAFDDSEDVQSLIDGLREARNAAALAFNAHCAARACKRIDPV